jgi:hypothetical protein
VKINDKLNKGYFCYYSVPEMKFEKWIGPFEYEADADAEVRDVSYEGVSARTIYRVRLKDGTWVQPEYLGGGYMKIPAETELYQAGA